MKRGKTKFLATYFSSSLSICIHISVRMYVYIYIYIHMRLFTTIFHLQNHIACTLNRGSQCTVCLKHKSAWDAAHSGSQRSQCKLMQIRMGRWVKTVFYFISFLFVFMAGKSGITLWTLHQSNHCFLLFCIFFFRNTMGRTF